LTCVCAGRTVLIESQGGQPTTVRKDDDGTTSSGLVRFATRVKLEAGASDQRHHRQVEVAHMPARRTRDSLRRARGSALSAPPRAYPQVRVTGMRCGVSSIAGAHGTRTSSIPSL
jgi:hypothetical protein